MSTKLTSDRLVCVDVGYHWRPIATEPPPKGVKVQLINRPAGVALYGVYNQGSWYTHWAPLPTFDPKEPQ